MRERATRSNERDCKLQEIAIESEREGARDGDDGPKHACLVVCDGCRADACSLRPLGTTGVTLSISSATMALSGHWHYRESAWLVAFLGGNPALCCVGPRVLIIGCTAQFVGHLLHKEHVLHH